MARPRSPQREKAKELWENAKGKITLKELSESLQVSLPQLRKWRSLDKWETYQTPKDIPKKRGGQISNKNAVNHGAPTRNKNAETHGAYSTPRLQDLPEHQQEYIKLLGADVRANLEAELSRLLVKETDLENKMTAMKECASDTLFIERVVEVEGGEYAGVTTTKESAFERMSKLETMSSRVHGRILKTIDSLKAYENEERRADLEERKHNITVQKLTGEFVINEETRLIDDNTDGQKEDLDL